MWEEYNQRWEEDAQRWAEEAEREQAAVKNHWQAAQDDLCERVTRIHTRVEGLREQMAEAQAKNISTQERVAQVEDIYVKVEMLQRSIAGVPAYVDLVDNRVAGVEAALGMLSIASQELEVAAMEGKEAQARLRAKYTGHEARIQDLVHSHKEHQEHAVRIEAQLQGQTLDLEKKIALLEGQFQLCRAEIAHSAQIEAILNTRAAPDLLTATLLNKIEVIEKTTQR